MNLPLLLAIIFLINLPFGYWRAGTNRFSRVWFLAVHAPIPAVILLRLAFGFGWIILPLTILAFTAGQYAGGISRSILAK